MIVIFEGVDKSGKTTLFDDVVNYVMTTGHFQDYQVLTFKAGIKPKGIDDAEKVFGQYKGVFDLHDQNEDTLLLMDRSYISELVYSGVKRDYDAMDNDEYDDLLSRQDILLVYVSTDEASYADRFASEGEDYVVTDDIPDLMSRYDEVINDTLHRLVRIITPSPRDENLKTVISEMRKLHEHLRS